MFDLLAPTAPAARTAPPTAVSGGAGPVSVGRGTGGGRPALALRALPAGAAMDVMASLQRAGAELADGVVGCREWSGGERAAALEGLDRLAGVLATVRASLLVAEQAAGTSVAPGDRDFTAARARTTRAGYGHAAREVAQASTLVAMPAVADAVRDGRMPLGHVDVLARVSASASEKGAAALASPDGQARLVGLAQRLPVKDFAARLAQLVAIPDPAGVERDHAAQRSARYLRLSHQPDGTYLRGRLDRVAGEVLRVALAGTGQAPDETRDADQASADALVALAQRAVSGMAGVRARRTEPGSGRPLDDPGQDAADARLSGTSAVPHLSLIVPAETFAELRSHAMGHDGGAEGAVAFDGGAEGAVAFDGGAKVAVASDGGAQGAVAPPWSAVAPATLEDGTPVAMSQLAAALCDCEISRIVLAAGSVPVDLGRTQRLYPAAHRRAVIVRDRHCAWNGCAVPAAYCEVHHIRWWVRDRGPTSLDNAVLLCSHHHHVIHALDVTIQRGGPPPRSPVDVAAGLPVEPIRYTYRRRDGRLLNAPPGVAAAEGAGTEA
ncbi:MAG TPA: HNH endonuclease signature motif containing protein [Actinotalea sp.]|nr:HNH endonuclease signature motif containing protein [Actinotalea sp.]